MMFKNLKKRITKNLLRQKVVGLYHDLTPEGEKVIRRDLCDLKDFDEHKVLDLWIVKHQEIEREQRSTSYSFRELSDRYLDSVAKKRNRNTYDTYKISIVRFLDVVGNMKLEDFTSEVADDFLHSIRDSANATQRKHCTAVNMFLKWADEFEPHSIHIKLPKKRRKNPKIFLDEEYEFLRDHILNKFENAPAEKSNLYWNHLRALIMFRETGMRRGEVFCLPYRNINSDYIIISDNDEVDELVKGGDESEIVISDALKAFLVEDRKYSLKIKDVSRKFYLSDGKGGLVFKRKDSITQALSRHAKDAGLSPEAKICHGHRATLITKIVDKYGVAEAQEVARHKSEQTTLGYVDRREIRKKLKSVINNL